MDDWTSGYVAEIDYVYGYYNELNPLRARLALNTVGLNCPQFSTGCELGFGQGLSVNMHAAASATVWHANDFNPAHASFARELATISGGAADLRDESFEQFCTRKDLPDFDYIGLHGVWSWISDENRRFIADFLRRKLKVGGVLYISYNTLPGWAPMVPFRHLMTQHAAVMSSSGVGVAARVDAAMDFMDRLFEAGSAYGELQPKAVNKLKSLKEQNRSYLAHEYFNRDWKPMHFSEMADWLSPAKLTYACSAAPLDHVDALNLSDSQQALLRDIPDAGFRQAVRDFMVNQQFRRDYWVRGARRLSAAEQIEAFRDIRVVLTMPKAEVTLSARGARGEAELHAPIYGPILELMKDHRSRTLGEVAAAVGSNALDLWQTVQAVTVLTGKGAMTIAQQDEAAARAKPRTDRLNAYLLEKARTVGTINFLASPVTGGGIPLGRVEQLFLLARKQGKSPAAWANQVADIFAAQGETLKKEGKDVDPSEVPSVLAEYIDIFSRVGLPMLEALMVV